MNFATEEIRSLVTSILQNQGLFFIDIVLRGQRNNQVLEIFVDSEESVTAETCAAISREISRVLDRSDIVQGKYTLVVSSPGIDSPLKLPLQYKKNVGRKLKVVFHDGTNNKTIQGTLIDCTDTKIFLDGENNISYTLPYHTIKEAKVALPW